MERYEKVSKDVEALADNIIKKNDMVDASTANICYIFNMNPKWSHAGVCRRVSGLLKFFTGYDYIIELNKTLWSVLNPVQQEALLCHELTHIKKVISHRGHEKWIIEKHTAEEFSFVVSKYGLWNAGIKELLQSAIKKVKGNDEEKGKIKE